MIELDRRRFLQMAGSASLLSTVGSKLGWASIQPRMPKFAYVGTDEAIHVYSISKQQPLRELQTVSSARPAALAIAKGRLYVANDVSQVGNLPRGSVESYAIDPLTGRLEWINRVPLSLSAVGPRALAISPDGRSIVVAIHGGGAYNVISLDEDGRLGKVTGIVKEIGSGPHPLQTAAHPSAIVFDRQGRALTADMGADRLNVLAFVNSEITVSKRCEVAAGSGPASVVLHPHGTHAYIAQALNGTLSSFGYGPTAALKLNQTVRVAGHAEAAALAMHPSGEALYSSHGRSLQTWRLTRDGRMQPSHRLEGLYAHTLEITAEGDSLFALSKDAMLRMKIDAGTRIPSIPEKVLSLSHPISIEVV